MLTRHSLLEKYSVGEGCKLFFSLNNFNNVSETKNILVFCLAILQENSDLASRNGKKILGTKVVGETSFCSRPFG